MARIVELRVAYAEARRADADGVSLGPVAVRCNGLDGLVSATFVNVEPPLVQLDWRQQAWTLQAVPTASGAKYAGASTAGEVRFWTKGDEALLQPPGKPELRCTVERIG